MPRHQLVGITPLSSIKLNKLVITSITSFEQFLINSFLIISIPHALLFFNFLITSAISFVVKFTFNSSFAERSVNIGSKYVELFASACLLPSSLKCSAKFCKGILFVADFDFSLQPKISQNYFALLDLSVLSLLDNCL